MSDSDERSGHTTAYKVKAGIFLAATGGIGLLAGFSSALAAAKKQDPKSFDQGLVGSLSPHERKARTLHDTGAKLAARALGFGTLYAIGGCGILFYAMWKISGASDLADFRQRAGSILPKVPKNDPPQSRTEFSGVNDLLQYLIDKDNEEKALKKLNNNDK